MIKMKINISKVLNEIVYFSTDYGSAKGIWKGIDQPVEEEYFVELDIDNLYNYDDFTVSKIKEYQIKILDEKIQLTMLLIEYDEFGCATFQFGDSLIEIETNFDRRFFLLENLYVTILVEKLNIYDENI